MLRCMLGSVKGVKSENPKGNGEIIEWEKGVLIERGVKIKTLNQIKLKWLKLKLKLNIV